MMHIVVVLETGSDFPGIEAAFGPFDTYEAADAERGRAKRLTLAESDDHVQVVRIETIRDPL